MVTEKPLPVISEEPVVPEKPQVEVDSKEVDGELDDTEVSPVTKPFGGKVPNNANLAEGDRRASFFRRDRFRTVECFDCSHLHEVTTAAKSTLCPACSSYISLQDIEINDSYSANIRTRGTVTINKRGILSSAKVACDYLKVYGQLSGSVDCTGDVIFRTSGQVMGEIRCHRLLIERKSEVKFFGKIYANEVVIHGPIVADVHCPGPIEIHKRGGITGDVKARRINVASGGHLQGNLEILKSEETPAPKEPKDDGDSEDKPLFSPHLFGGGDEVIRPA